MTDIAPTNNGHDHAILIRETAPDGSITAHRVTITGRLIDALYHAGIISHDQHQAGTAMRDAYERAGPVMGRDCARPMELGYGGEREFMQDEDAWAEYMALLRAAHPYGPLIRAVCIEDRPPIRQADQIGTLEALSRMAAHMGLVARS